MGWLRSRAAAAADGDPDDSGAGLFSRDPLFPDQGDRTAADGRLARRRHHDDRGPVRQRAGSPAAAGHDGAAAGAGRTVHHHRRTAGDPPGGGRRRLRGGRVRRGVRPSVRAARQGAGHGRVHGVLLHFVSASEPFGVALDDRRGGGGDGVHVCDERLRAARSARTRAASNNSRAAGTDGDCGRHHGRGRADRPPRRAATPPHARTHHPAQRNRADGARTDRRQSSSRNAVAGSYRGTVRPLAV